MDCVAVSKDESMAQSRCRYSNLMVRFIFFIGWFIPFYALPPATRSQCMQNSATLMHLTRQRPTLKVDRRPPTLKRSKSRERLLQRLSTDPGVDSALSSDGGTASPAAAVQVRWVGLAGWRRWGVARVSWPCQRRN